MICISVNNAWRTAKATNNCNSEMETSDSVHKFTAYDKLSRVMLLSHVIVQTFRVNDKCGYKQPH